MAGKKDRDRGPDREEAPKISEADRALWRKVTQDAKPLEKRDGAAAEPPAPPSRTSEAQPSEAQAPEAQAPEASRSSPRRAAAPRPAAAGGSRTTGPDLEPGRAAGLDRRNLERLRRGKLPVEATIDLHGDTQAVAHRRLEAFLARAQAGGRRCVLVITGKGRLGRGEGGQEPGVIRANLPRWLNEAPNRDRVLAFAQAQPAHGGAGAFYVLLKRRREG